MSLAEFVGTHRDAKKFERDGFPDGSPEATSAAIALVLDLELAGVILDALRAELQQDILDLARGRAFVESRRRTVSSLRGVRASLEALRQGQSSRHTTLAALRDSVRVCHTTFRHAADTLVKPPGQLIFFVGSIDFLLAKLLAATDRAARSYVVLVDLRRDKWVSLPPTQSSLSGAAAGFFAPSRSVWSAVRQGYSRLELCADCPKVKNDLTESFRVDKCNQRLGGLCAQHFIAMWHKELAAE